MKNYNPYICSTAFMQNLNFRLLYSSIIHQEILQPHQASSRLIILLLKDPAWTLNHGKIVVDWSKCYTKGDCFESLIRHLDRSPLLVCYSWSTVPYDSELRGKSKILSPTPHIQSLRCPTILSKWGRGWRYCTLVRFGSLRWATILSKFEGKAESQKSILS